jgi:hypothetical protein
MMHDLVILGACGIKVGANCSIDFRVLLHKLAQVLIKQGWDNVIHVLITSQNAYRFSIMHDLDQTNVCR